ncbi:hypothetical protein DLM76_09600 [Leptospira yasudae]|nr:hypothetical protein DLM76_09600 [Leptospira yasudae]
MRKDAIFKIATIFRFNRFFFSKTEPDSKTLNPKAKDFMHDEEDFGSTLKINRQKILNEVRDFFFEEFPQSL